MYWTSDLKNDTKFVGIRDNTLFIANPKTAAIDNVVADFKYKTGNTSGFFELPLSYIKNVRLYKNYHNIELNCQGGVEEELIVTDSAKREEIFAFLKKEIPDMIYYVDSYSAIRAGKKPLIAAIVVMGLFVWSYLVAAGLEKGDMYDVDNERYHSVAGIVLVLANLGTTNLILIFGSLLAIATLAFVRKAKNPPVVWILSR